jgi:hypothetical protein
MLPALQVPLGSSELMEWDDEGWWSRQVTYGEAVYAARCPQCARFVKLDPTAKLLFESAELKEPNATCTRHGRVKTPFLCWTSDGKEW